MKKISVLFVSLLMVIGLAGITPAFDAPGGGSKAKAGGWKKCKFCHPSGKKGMKGKSPSREELKAKFKTAADMVAAAKASKHWAMKSVKGKDAVLKAAAAELYK